jgi:DNA-binding SARP family transcriptional activator
VDDGVTQLRVLGSVTATAQGAEVALGGRKQQEVLLRVLVAEGEAVPAEQLVSDVWGERATPATLTSVHTYVSRLRRLLGTQALPRHPHGYRLDRGTVSVDADVFVAEVDDGRRALARGDDAGAARLLETALGRWTGPAAFGPARDAHFLAPTAARLEELRVVAAETLADAHARRGRAADDIARLEELAARDPLRESVALRLVRALYAAGRQAAALAAYERCRAALAEELGVDPTPALRRVHAAVLAQEPVPVAVGVVAPTHLPPRNRAFVGRDGLIAAVGAALDDDSHGQRAVALTGLGGVGKTELALELAHRRHRHGRVAWWIAAEDPAGTATGLADLAAALGIAGFERGEDTRAALWAELDRTPGWLLVYDNADEPKLLEPFLPAARHGDVVITSRNQAWRRLARPVAVGPLPRPEAVAYVAARTGDDPAAAGRLAELLGDLPLALEQACAYIEQTGMPVPDYVRLFESRRDHLLLRDADGSGRTVATTWRLAFDRIASRSPEAAALLETIAFLAPDAITVATLRHCRLTAGEPDELELQDALGELLRLSLVDRDAGSVRVHRLVQDVVRLRMTEEARNARLAATVQACMTQAAEGGAAVDAVAAHLVALATHAEAPAARTGAAVPPGLVEGLATVAERQAERALYPAAEHVLRTALHLHGPGGAPALRGRLVCQLGQVLDAAGSLGPALELHREAVRILDAVVAPDDVVLAHAHNRLGHVLNCADDAPAAIEAHRHALATLRGAGHDALVPPVLIDLGYTLWGAGRLDEAHEALVSGRALLESQGRKESRDWAHATAGLGMVEQDAGNLDVAVRHQRTAIAVFQRVGGPDHPDTAQALDKLGYALRLQGRSGEAIDAHRRGVRLLERVLGPDDSRVGMALTNLGLAHADDGDLERAIEVQARARAIFIDALGPVHSSTLLAGRRLAVVLAAAGQGVRASTVIEDVLETATARPDIPPAQIAQIAEDAVIVYTAVGDLDARQHWDDVARGSALGAAPPA